MHSITCDYCKVVYNYEHDDGSVDCLPDGYFTGGDWICDECGSCPECGKTLEKEPRKRGREGKATEMCRDCYDELYGLSELPIDEQWGMSTLNISDDSLFYQLEYHREQVKRGEVGTPNVYVRIGDLEREAEARGLL